MLHYFVFLSFALVILASDDLPSLNFPEDSLLLLKSPENTPSTNSVPEPLSSPLFESVLVPSTLTETIALYPYTARTNLEYSMKRGEHVKLHSSNNGWCFVGDEGGEFGHVPCSFLSNDFTVNQDYVGSASLGVPPNPMDVVHLKSTTKGRALFAAENNWCFVVFEDEECYVPCAHLKVVNGSWDKLLDSASQGFVASVGVPWEVAPRIFKMRNLKFKLRQDKVIELPTKYNAAAILGRSSNDWCLVELVLLNNGPQEIGDEGIVPCAFFLNLNLTSINPYSPPKNLPRISLVKPVMDYGGHYDPSQHLLPMKGTLQYIVVNQLLNNEWLEVSNPDTGEWGFASPAWFMSTLCLHSPTFSLPISGLQVPSIKAHAPAIVTNSRGQSIISSYEAGIGGIGHTIGAHQVPMTSTSLHMVKLWLHPVPRNPPMQESSNLLIRFIVKEFWKSFDWDKQTEQFQDLTFKERIGEGTFGDVYKVVSKSSKRTMAVKKIRMTDSNSTANVLNEITAMIRVKGCEGIPTLHHVYLINEVNVKERAVTLTAHLLMDYIDGHSLDDLICDHVHFTAKQMVFLTVSLTKTLFALHRANIVHRDIKPLNVILRVKDGMPILVDLGNCLDCERQSLDNQVMTTTNYCSPEAINRKPYSYDLDIWSLGIVLLEAYQGCFLYDKLEDYSLERMCPLITKCASNPDNTDMQSIKPRPLSQFLQQCFRPAHSRPSIKDLLKHPYLKRNSSPIVTCQLLFNQQPSSPVPVRKEKKSGKRKRSTLSSKSHRKSPKS